MLAAALAWAARGFPVFPLAEGTKDVPIVDEFYDVASTDPAVITMWWRDPLTGAERDYNVGVSTTGRRVIDIDVKKGRDGIANYLQLGGHFNTLVVKTPSGGLHCYFAGEDVAGRVGILGKDSGLDIRSYHNYVLAPGSRTAEGVYSLEIDHTPVELPAEFTPHLRAPLERAQGEVLELAETPAMIARATAYLQTREPAVEGQGGDDHTYQTAARLRDLGISEVTALALLLEHFNPRCAPPWEPDDLKQKVANAYGYGTAPFGVLSPETHYGDLAIPSGPHLVENVTNDAVADDAFRFGNALDPFTLPPRPWLYNRILMRGKVTSLVGAGSAGKSVLTLQIAAHLAVGKPFAGYTLKELGKPYRSIIYNAEDDREEQTRRLWAICSHFKFDWPTVRDSIALVSRKELRLMLTEGDPPRLNNEHVVPLVRAGMAPDVGLISLDPLVTLHQSREEDNVAMRYIVETCSIIAEEANVPVLVVHHIGKPGANSKMDEMYAARGGGEIINTARVGLNLTSPSKIEAPLFGIKPEDRHAFVALTDAKMNLSLAGDARWFKKKGIRLPNGDEVGVLDPYDMAAVRTTQNNVHAAAIAEAMTGQGQATCTINEAANILKAADLLLNKMSAGELRAKVMTTLASPVTLADGGVVKIVQELEGGRFQQKVVLE